MVTDLWRALSKIDSLFSFCGLDLTTATDGNIAKKYRNADCCVNINDYSSTADKN